MAGTTDLQRLVVSLEANLDKYNREMLKASQSTDHTMRQIESRIKKTEGIIGEFGRTFGIALGAAEVARFAREAIKSVAELGDQAKRAGVGVEDLQAAMLAIRRQGGNADDLVAAFGKLNLSLGEASAKGNELGIILKANGIALKSLQGDPVRALTTIADLMKNAVSEQDRAVIGSAAFGKSYRDILPFLTQGGAAIKEAMQVSRDLGGIISEEDVQRAEKFNAVLTAISDVVLVKLKNLVLDLAKDFDDVLRLVELIAKKLDIPVDPAWRKLFDTIKTIENQPSAGADGKGAGGTAATIVPTADAIKQLTKNMDEARDATKGLFHDLIDGLRQGKSLTDTLSTAFSHLADKMIDALENQAIDALLGKKGQPGGGLIGAMFGTATGTAPSAAAQVAGIAAGIPLDIPGVGPPGSAHAPPNNVNDYVTRRQIGGVGPPIVQKALPGSLGIHRNMYDLPGMADFTGRQLGGVSGSVPYSDMINAAARRNGIQPSLLAALIKQESKFDPLAYNTKSHAAGLTQLMPGTAKELGVNDPFDPLQSINGGSDYLSKMMKLSHGNVPGALARYNWGPGNFANKGGMANLPAETSGYIANIQKYQQEFSQSLATVSSTAKSAASNFQTGFAPAVQNILSIVGKAAGGVGAGMGGSGFFDLAGLFAGRAGGGPMSAGVPYLVGERGPELVMPNVPSMVVPNHALGNAGGQISVHVTKSPYFDVHVQRIAANGDRQTLNTARRNYPDTAARFSKLGTTTR